MSNTKYPRELIPSGIVAYGISPVTPDIWPEPVHPDTGIIPNTAPIYVPPALTPCAKCKRHISTPDCPFCFAKDVQRTTAREEALFKIVQALLSKFESLNSAIRCLPKSKRKALVKKRSDEICDFLAEEISRLPK